jgi:mannosyltransferase
MRLPSVLAMAGTAALVAVLGRRFWGESAGLLGGLLFAAVPAVSRYGQEIRGYALAAFFATLATLALTGALHRSRWWRWVLYGLCLALMGWSHQVTMLVVAGHGVAVLGTCLRRGRLRLLWWSLSVLTSVGALVPLSLRGLGQYGTQLNWLSSADPEKLAGLLDPVFMSGIVGGAVLGLAMPALRQGQSGPVRLWAAALWVSALAPVGLLYAYDQVVAPILVARYLLFVVPVLCVLAGSGLALLRLPAALAAVMLLALIGVPAQQSVRDGHSPYNYRAAAAVIRDNARPGDGIIYEPRDSWQFTDTALRYYLRDRLPRDVLLAEDETARASLWASECPDPAACLQGVNRVWAVNTDPTAGSVSTATNRLSGPERSALAAYRQTGKWRVRGFTIVLWQR